MTDENDVLEARADALVEDHVSLLEDLVKLRKKHNLSQKDVAERMGVKQPTVSAFERYNANPRLSSIRRYAMAVDAMVQTQVTDDCAASPEKFDAVLKSAGVVWGTPGITVGGAAWIFSNEAVSADGQS
jgi:transcriptional regulator with XRE-family HTH domain